MQKSEIKFLDLLEKDIYNGNKVKIPQSVLMRVAYIKNKAKMAKIRNEKKMKLIEMVEFKNKEDAVNLLLDVIGKQNGVISNLRNKCSRQAKELEKKDVEHVIAKRRKGISPERFLKVSIVDSNYSNYSKITLNPVSGRVELKVSNKSSDRVKEKYIQVGEMIKDPDYDFAPFTYRGKIIYVRRSDTYRVSLQTNNKMFKVFFEINDK